jgi:hypothetical protein
LISVGVTQPIYFPSLVPVRQKSAAKTHIYLALINIKCRAIGCDARRFSLPLQQSSVVAVEYLHIAVKNAKEPIGEKDTKKHVQRKDV